MDVTPNSTINVEVVARPTSHAAEKTLMRLFRKDPQIAYHMRTQKRNRPSVRSKQRGGRMWHHRMKTKPPIKLTPGSRYALHATVDVIRDLASVERFVKVEPK